MHVKNGLWAIWLPRIPRQLDCQMHFTVIVTHLAMLCRNSCFVLVCRGYELQLHSGPRCHVPAQLSVGVIVLMG